MEKNNNDMELINKYSRKQLEEQQVYVFNITLCDNEVDRDFERFTKQALEQLQPMFEGKTGIFDHNMKSSGQSARVFKTWVETDDNRKNSLGESYTCLRAKAYMIRTEDNKSLIDEIEGGIKKEISVGCSMGSIACSICGKDMKSHECNHIKGRTYDSKLCFGVLTEPLDAYEWSFVAVPSQRAAGVTKSFIKEEKMENAVDIVKSAKDDAVLTASQIQSLRDYIVSLEELAEDAKAYKQHMLESIKKYALIVLPEVNVNDLLTGCKGMSVNQLDTFRKGLKAQSEQLFSSGVQLKPVSQNINTHDNKAFKI
ncbi:MAG: hypothetical protein NC122_09055 [Faecalibacterium sp.]|nr:hypothetical protein [Ruminococcus sp.]MCM1392675.1 hypothetical protein [Ruminococcus sp.]MCM1486343.1 hypothetical protein [Faecalibacterium sp.]